MRRLFKRRPAENHLEKEARKKPRYQLPRMSWMSDLKKAADYGVLLAEKEKRWSG